jgi:hypothetical protein
VKTTVPVRNFEFYYEIRTAGSRGGDGQETGSEGKPRPPANTGEALA